MKHLVKIGAVNQIGRAAKEFDGGLLAKCARRPQNRNPLWRLQRQTSRHDFAPNGRHMAVSQRPRVGLLDFVDDLGNPVGTEKRGAFLFFDFAHRFSHPGAVIEKREQLLVDGVDLDAQFRQRGQGIG